MKLKYIDSIRGIAILMVILVHTSQSVAGLTGITSLLSQYGQMGVQLFFVASAYTLCLSFTNRETERLPLAKYAIRRYFRIAPAYYAGMIVYFLIALMEVRKNGYIYFHVENYTFQNVILNVLLLNGLNKNVESTIVVPGGWSIGVEMLFYLFFPILFKGFKRINQPFIIVLSVVFSFILFQCVLYCLHHFFYLPISNNNFIYFSLLVQFPVFVVGIGYFFYSSQRSFSYSAVIDVFLFLLFTTLALILWIQNKDFLFSIIPFVSSISFVFLVEIFKKIKTLNHPILAKIGTVSFSMYLIHFIFAWELSVYINRYTAPLGPTMSLLIVYLITVFLTYRVGLISVKFIEQPCIDFGKKIIQKMSN